MCGIVGYIGSRGAYPILINGLKRLEYRGYDSAGVALQNGGVRIYRKTGKVARLEEFCKDKDTNGTIGIGHTRWATHGEPSDANAHPHISKYGDVVLVHNGIIENYTALALILNQCGYALDPREKTDTEILANWIEHIWHEQKKESTCTFEDAVRDSLRTVVGAYAIVVITPHDHQMIVANHGSTGLVLGIGRDEIFVGSDATPFIDYTKDVITIEDGQMAVLLEKGEYHIKNSEQKEIEPAIEKVLLTLEEIEKGAFPHFMLKEIFEQPKTIADSMRGRISLANSKVLLGGMKIHEERIARARKIVFVACGTSYYASLIGEYLIETLARIDVQVEYASEFRYRNPILGEDDVVIGISQSGETADTNEAVKLAHTKGALVLGICNVVGAMMSKINDGGTYTHAGKEIGVASTKAFTAQLTVLSLFALWMGRTRGMIDENKYQILLRELESIPASVEKVLAQDALIRDIAKKYYQSTNAIYLGRGINFPVALEGALKLKEISYIHAEGYPAAEMKHGPIALIDENMPVIFIATEGEYLDKVKSNMNTVKSRGGKIIAIVTEGDTEISSLANVVVPVPKVSEIFSPFLTVVPLQLLAYHIAAFRGTDIDKPRNLSKSVSVE